ncbi:MAG TPA: methyl-accepting chemotaxis protein [Halanaerobiales bacterium]|nr:methyl-accepting chemotaxis protein [Halanaerobiales bacterium]HPZ63759.1 methyl-accepting chemotaxis protein [Halanaerobiales bacterium]HQD04025.1 methyl-accepting chemotaxis protein [Halanaerobiales bacterium]
MKWKIRKINIHSIRVRLLIIPILIVSIIAIGMTMLTSYNTKESLLNTVAQNGNFMAQGFIKRLEDNTRSLEVINAAFEHHIRTVANAVMNMADEEIDNRLMAEWARDLYVDELNLYNRDGVILYSNIPQYVGHRIEAGHTLYRFFRSSDRELMEEVRKDTQSDTYYKYGIVKNTDGTAVQVGIKADTIREITEQFEYQKLVEEFAGSEEVVYALFIGTNFRVLASSEKEYINMDVSDDPGAHMAIINRAEYTSEVVYGEEKTKVYDTVYPVVINGELLGAVNIGFSMEKVNATIRKNNLYMYLWGAVAGILLVAILFSSSNYAVKTIDKLKVLMDSMAKGDFTNKVTDNLLKKKDEFGEISRAVMTMQNSISNIIRKVLENSEEVASHSEELTATIEHSTTASAEVAIVIEGIAGSASDQASDTEKGFATITELGNIVNKNNEYIQALNSSLEKVTQLKEEGSILIKDLVEKTNISNKSSREIKEVINNTNQSAEKIAVASEMIKNIAGQTNLLALNAAIEAARAGESGRGFAVVAEEIRELAEQSNQFTEEISTIIRDLTDKTSTAVQVMEEIEKVVASQSASVDMTDNKFEGISSSIEEMKKVIQAVNEASKEIDIQKEEIVKVMENLSAISEENAAASQEASASVEEQTAGMSEIAKASEELARIAEELNRQVEQFKI